jgi:hypothetical protein
MLYRLIPAVVATANGIAVAIGFYVGRVDVYPVRLLMVQVAVVLATLLLAPLNRAVLGVGFILTVLCIVSMFSAMIWYIPTLAAAVWRVQTAQKYDSR